MEKVIYMVDIPAKNIPALKYEIARKGDIKQIMMTTWGGLGDQVCGEPALRYAFKLFKDYKLSLLTKYPELFTHLPFEKVYSPEEARELNDQEWLVINTNEHHMNMTRNFIHHNYSQVVDFSTICAFQRQIDVKSRQVWLPTKHADRSQYQYDIVIHPGRHWQSKTFPAYWWKAVVDQICSVYGSVAVVGKHVDEETGFVDFELHPNCTDLRNKLSLVELSTVLQDAKLVITNDSAPLHMASAGNAYILFGATCKEPEYLLHWRHGIFGWKMKNFTTDGLWNYQDSCPVRAEPLPIDQMPHDILVRSLPDPKKLMDRVNQVMRDFV